MADPNEPKKETVRITLPTRSPATQPGERKETVRINLPKRPPQNGPLRPVVDPKNRPPPPPLSKPPLPPPPASKAAAPPSFRPPAVPGKLPSTNAPVRPPVLPKSIATPPTPPADLAEPLAAPPLVPGTSGIYPGAGSTGPGPKKETARISMLPEPPPPPKPTVNMAKTQPLIKTPVAETPSAAVNIVAPLPAKTQPSLLDLLDDIPMAVTWAFFGISLVVLLIEAWNYFTV